MQFTIARDTVIDTISHVARRAKRGTIPILEHILLQTVGSAIVTLGGHDAQSSSSGAMVADVEWQGACVVPGEQFLSIIERMPKGAHVKLKFTEGEQVELSCGRSRYKLSTLPVADFPPLFVPENPATLSLTSDDISQVFSGPNVVVKEDNARQNYAGVYWHADERFMLAGCATDGATMVKSACDVKFPKGAATIIIPRRAIDEILKTTGDNGGEFSWSDKILQVKSGEWVYATKLIDATFPDYAKFIPKANGHYIKVASEELRGAIYRLQAIEANRSFVKLGWEDGAKELSAHLNGNGEGGEFIECEAIKMEAGGISVSSAALMDIATALDSKSLTFHITAHNQPFRVSADDRPNAVVMQAPIVGRP